MDFQDAEKFIPGVLGSFAYFLYVKYLRKLDWKKAIVTLIVGILFSAFIGPQFTAWLPAIKYESTGFTVGFLGMKLAEWFVGLDIEGVLRRYIDKGSK